MRSLQIPYSKYREISEKVQKSQNLFNPFLKSVQFLLTDLSPANDENNRNSLPLDGGGRGRGWTRLINPPPYSSPARGEEIIGVIIYVIKRACSGF